MKKVDLYILVVSMFSFISVIGVGHTKGSLSYCTYMFLPIERFSEQELLQKKAAQDELKNIIVDESIKFLPAGYIDPEYKRTLPKKNPYGVIERPRKKV
jgi:hypothetical protein